MLRAFITALPILLLTATPTTAQPPKNLVPTKTIKVETVMETDDAIWLKMEGKIYKRYKPRWDLSPEERLKLDKKRRLERMKEPTFNKPHDS